MTLIKKNTTIIYPIYGVGKVIDVFDKEMDGKKIRYYKMTFQDSSMTIQLPIEKAETLGLRQPLSRAKLQAELKKLNTNLKVDRKRLGDIENKVKIKLNSGKFEDVIEVINLIIAIGRRRREEGRNLSYTSWSALESAAEFLKSEVTLVLGEKAYKKCSVEIDKILSSG